MNPRPVPSECTDMTPHVMWGTLWELNPDGTMEMPACGELGCTTVWFWKNRRHLTHRLPDRFWRDYRARFPNGHTEDRNPRVYDDGRWDDTKHGYWRGRDGRLQYRHPDGTVSFDVNGADRWP